jgi:hypothetical protein
MRSRLVVLVNLSGRPQLREFRSATVRAPNVVAVHLEAATFLRMGGIDAHYMSLTSAERWGAKPLKPLTVSLLHTSAADRQEGFPPYILTGMVLHDDDPDTSEFVIPSLARAIDRLLSDTTILCADSIRTIGFSEHNLRFGGATLAQVGRLVASEFAPND